MLEQVVEWLKARPHITSRDHAQYELAKRKFSESSERLAQCTGEFGKMIIRIRQEQSEKKRQRR